MTRLTKEQVEALKDFTPGPWSWEEIDPTDPDWSACEVFGGDGFVSTMTFGPENAALTAAAPDMHATCLALFAEVGRLQRERDVAFYSLRMWRDAYQTGRNEPLAIAYEAALKGPSDD